MCSVHETRAEIRDPCLRDKDETKTLQLPRRWPKPKSESRELQRLAETFSMTYGETHYQWKKLYGLISSHHGKRFLFVILWALHFILTIITE